jgi:hypothetical protein
LPAAERRAQIDLLVDPILDPEVADGVKAALLVGLFQAVLAARMMPVLDSQPARQRR